MNVTAPFTPALDYMKSVLFRPFNMEKWLTLGFCAWLAALGSGGGTGFGSSWNSGDSNKNNNYSVESARQWITENLSWIIPLASVGIIVGIAIWITLTWLSSRGQFMFLHGVVTNQGAVKAPWKQFAAPAHSLFLFRLILGIVTATLLLPLIIIIGFLVAPMISNQSIQEGPLFGAILLAMITCAVAILAFVAKFLTTSFVVPIMYSQGSQCIDAWRTFLELFSEHLGTFVLYMLFLLLLHVAVGIALIVLTLVTCCIAGCIMGIPFVGTVLLLPVSVFFRSYSLLFLSQFGEPYAAFRLRSA